MIDVRCKGCNKKLFVANTCDIAMKCGRCKMIFEYKVFNNMFVTSQYDPTVYKNSLRIKHERDIIVPDTREVQSQ